MKLRKKCAIDSKMKNLAIKYILLTLLAIATTLNVSFFFYIKNSTHYLNIQVYHLKNDVETEKHNLSIQKAEFNKKYNINNLQELAKNRLNLKFSSVDQIVDFDDIISK